MFSVACNRCTPRLYKLAVIPGHSWPTMSTCTAHQCTVHQAFAWPLMVQLSEAESLDLTECSCSTFQRSQHFPLTWACQQTFGSQGSFSAALALAKQPSAAKQHAEAGAASRALMQAAGQMQGTWRRSRAGELGLEAEPQSNSTSCGLPTGVQDLTHPSCIFRTCRHMQAAHTTVNPRNPPAPRHSSPAPGHPHAGSCAPMQTDIAPEHQTWRRCVDGTVKTNIHCAVHRPRTFSTETDNSVVRSGVCCHLQWRELSEHLLFMLKFHT